MELMDEFIEKIRAKYGIPKEYRAYLVNSGVWERFKNKRISYSEITLHEKLVVNYNFGWYKNRDLMVINISDAYRELGHFTFLFTEDINKTFEKYFKKKPIPKEKWLARKGVFQPVETMLGWTFEKVDVGNNNEPVLNDNLNSSLKEEIRLFLKSNTFPK